MAKTRLSDLTDHLFLQLEKLKDFGDLDSTAMAPENYEETKEKFDMAMKSAKMTKEISDTILEVNRVQLDALRLCCEYNLSSTSLPGTMGVEYKSVQPEDR